MDYFTFQHTNHTFCCSQATEGYIRLPEPHPLNDFIEDIDAVGQPRRLIRMMDGYDNGVYAAQNTFLQANGKNPGHPEVVKRDSCNLYGYRLKKTEISPNSLSNPEPGVVQKCIVLIEYFPQHLIHRFKEEIILYRGGPLNRKLWHRGEEDPRVMSTGRPMYRRQGQKVWIGRGYEESEEERQDREEAEKERLCGPQAVTEDGEVGANDVNKAKRILAWDWQEASLSEVVPATLEIFEVPGDGVECQGVGTQTLDCRGGHYTVPLANITAHKWKFSIYYKNVDLIAPKSFLEPTITEEMNPATDDPPTPESDGTEPKLSY